MPRWSCCQDPRPRRVGKVRRPRNAGLPPAQAPPRSTRSRDGRRPRRSFRASRWPLPAGRGRGRLSGRHVQHALADGRLSTPAAVGSPPRRPRPARSSRSGRAPRSTGRPSCRAEQSPAGAPPAPPRAAGAALPRVPRRRSGTPEPVAGSRGTPPHVLSAGTSWTCAGDRGRVRHTCVVGDLGCAQFCLQSITACCPAVPASGVHASALSQACFAQRHVVACRCCCCRSPAWCRPRPPATRPHRQSTP